MKPKRVSQRVIIYKRNNFRRKWISIWRAHEDTILECIAQDKKSASIQFKYDIQKKINSLFPILLLERVKLN
jgi:hypothetical protein